MSSTIAYILIHEVNLGAREKIAPCFPLDPGKALLSWPGTCLSSFCSTAPSVYLT